MNIKPLADRVIVQAAPAEKKTASGIIIPDTAQDKPIRGFVMAIGPKVTTVNVDDEVYYGLYAGIQIELEKKHYLIMRESDIFLVV